MKYIYVIGAEVVGIATLADGASASASGPAGSTEYVMQDTDPTQIGWACTVVEGVASFTAPATSYAPLTPMQFWFSFTYAERILLKALALTGLPATSTAAAIPIDPIVADFWETYQLAVTLQDDINPNLLSVQEAVTYLSQPTAPTPAIILAARVPQILAGVLQ